MSPYPSHKAALSSCLSHLQTWTAGGISVMLPSLAPVPPFLLHPCLAQRNLHTHTHPAHTDFCKPLHPPTYRHTAPSTYTSVTNNTLFFIFIIKSHGSWSISTNASPNQKKVTPIKDLIDLHHMHKSNNTNHPRGDSKRRVVCSFWWLFLGFEQEKYFTNQSSRSKQYLVSDAPPSPRRCSPTGRCTALVLPHRSRCRISRPGRSCGDG